MKKLSERIERKILDDDQYDYGNVCLLKFLGFTAKELADAGDTSQFDLNRSEQYEKYKAEMPDERFYSHGAVNIGNNFKREVVKKANNETTLDFTAEKPFEKLTTDVTEFKVCNDKVYLSPVLDLFNREIISYSISLSPNLQQVRDMLTGLFAKLPDTARPVFHSDQGWQYQHAEYQRLLAEHNITQSMSRKGNCMDNGAMENFFGRLKVEMFYGEQFDSVEDFIQALDDYIYYYNNDRISLKLKGMSPVQYRTHSQAS